jgi:peptidoglycan/LPS O-acetylase OafA/YrhL
VPDAVEARPAAYWLAPTFPTLAVGVCFADVTEGAGVSQIAAIAPGAGEDRPMIRPLTGVRAVAALWVMMLHFSGLVKWPDPLNRLAAYGATGVSLFFVLSGFVLTVNYRTWFANGLSRWRGFARARIARIVPIYLLGLLLAGIVMVWARHYYPGQYSAAVAANPSLHNIIAVFPLQLLAIGAWVPVLAVTDLWNTVGWSVSTELGFYAFFPLITYLVTSRLTTKTALLRTWIVLMATQFVVFTALLTFGHYHLDGAGQTNLRLALYEMPVFRLPEFMVGCVVGALFLRLRAERSTLVNRSGLAYRNSLLLLGLGWCVLAVYSPSIIGHPDGSLSATLLLELGHDVLFVPGLSAIIFSVALGPTFLHPVLDHRWAQVMGLASYSLYVIHFTLLLPVVLYYSRLGHRPPIWVPILLFAVIVAASLLVHKTVELPARRAVLRRGRRRAPTVSPGVSS